MEARQVSFRNPPLYETALGIQFSPVRDLKTAHLGLFWSRFLADQYRQPDEDLPTLDPVFERFGEERLLGPRVPAFRFDSGNSVRMRFATKDPSDTRLVQLQNGRVIVNWVRSSGVEYPRYGAMRAEVLRIWGLFTAFLTAESLGPAVPNQWEMTYVNHVLQGHGWDSLSDLQSLLPVVVPAGACGEKPESIEASWKYELPERRGRLHVELFHSWTEKSLSSPQLIAFNLTARGPINPDDRGSCECGLNLGHESIVKTFVQMTSAKAHGLWEREA